MDKSSEYISLDANEYIDKECSVLYDNKLQIMAIQNNVGALTRKGIEQYLSSMFKDGNYVFELKPVLSPNSAEIIKKRKILNCNMKLNTF